MSGTLLVNLDDLRDAIAAENERMKHRPVPTTPWVMPLGLDDLLAFVEAVEAARQFRAVFFVDDHEYGKRAQATYGAVRALDLALEKFS